ncbi:unnamed protein product, partial [Vitis vinifera]
MHQGYTLSINFQGYVPSFLMLTFLIMKSNTQMRCPLALNPKLVDILSHLCSENGINDYCYMTY